MVIVPQRGSAHREILPGPCAASAMLVGGKRLAVIAGPCSVEDEGRLLETAAAVKEGGAVGLRGGAYKPRTSP
ncbi:MAG: 3-deoxy-7-phosphoheptulonate synthase, partial [Planctomycetota bacterium]